MIVLMVLGALMIWEVLRWSCIEFYNEWTPGANSRRLRRLRKLQAATTNAIERELERLQANEERRCGDRHSRDHPTMMFEESRDENPSSSSDHFGQGRRSASSTTWEDTRRRSSRPRTPSPLARPMAPLDSPSKWSPASNVDYTMTELERVAHDVCMLMTCESRKEGLRTEGLPASGLKNDQATRLAVRMVSLMTPSGGPTVKQLKYVLWLWRVKDLSGRHVLRYHEVNDRSRISALINQWKNR